MKIKVALFFLLMLPLICSCRKASDHSRKKSKTGQSIVVEEPSLNDNNRKPDEENESEDSSSIEEDEVIETLIPQKNEDLLPRMISTKPNQILKREGYVVSYNSETKNANWVFWHLTKEHTSGPYSRKGISYMVDEEVNSPRQELEDWSSMPLQMDHGHLCPAGDNKWSQKAMYETFYLTNVCPQNSSLNKGDWEKLESRCRGWARHYGDIYIVAGPIFYNTNYETVGQNKVGIPDAFYKIVLCMNKIPKALGFVYPNVGKHHDIKHYVKTVNEVEKITGIDFFYNLPDDVEDKIESVSNFNKW